MDGKQTLKYMAGDFYDSLASAIDTRLAEFGIDPRLSAWIAGVAIKRICEDLRGLNVYFHKDSKRQLELRDESIFADFEAVPIYELATKHRISEMRIRQVVWAFNAAIYKEFNGVNHAVLASKYGISEPRVHRIIDREEWK